MSQPSILVKMCPKCGTNFEVLNKGYPRTYCSLGCANSRRHSEQTKRKVSKSAKDTWNKTSDEGKQVKLKALAKGKETNKKRELERIQQSSTEELGHSSRKKKVFLEQCEKCRKCGIKDWQDKLLTFELEHINGDKNNNKRENLEVLCPNCHAQTVTWRGRNNRNRSTRVRFPRDHHARLA